MKKTISLILSIAMILSTVAFAMPAFAIDLDFDVETAEDYAQTTEESGTAVLSGTKGDKDGLPGINLLTGTTEVYGFDDAGYYHAVSKDATARENAIIADPDNADNKVMWVGDVAYSNIGITPIPESQANNSYYPLANGKTFEDERVFRMSFDLKGTSTNHPIHFMSGYDNSKLNGGEGWSVIKSFIIEDGMNWTRQTAQFTYAQAIKSLKLFVLCFYNGGIPTGSEWYIDNLEIVPDYRIRFLNADGITVMATEYADGKATSYTIPSSIIDSITNDKFLGFKVKGTDDSELVTEVELSNADIDFVAVYDEALFAATETVEAKIGAKVEVTSKEAVASWSINDEELATFEGTEDKVVLTLAGYAGDLAVTAKDADDQIIGVKVIKLRGAELARPGVNFMTGTLEGYDFEGTDAERSLVFYTNGAAAAVENPDKTGNTSKMVGRYSSTGTGQNYPQFHFKRAAQNTLGTRPMLFTFDYYGDIENLWINGNGSYRVFGGIHATSWSSKSYVWQKGDIKTNNFYPQAGMRGTTYKYGYIDNVSLVPYYKVTYVDATGAEVSSEFVLPENRIYEIPAAKIDALDANKYEGYTVQGSDGSVVTSVNLSTSDIVLAPKTKDGVEIISPVVSGYANATGEIDPRYPGAYYTFDEPLDTTTLSLDELKNVWADSYVYDEDTNTLIVFSQTKQAVGNSEYFQAYDSNVKTASGKYVLFPKTPTLTYAAVVPNDGQNMIPYGNFETAYNPFYPDGKTVDLSIQDGKLYATANTDELSYPHVGFQTVLEAGATYKVYAESAPIDVQTEPGLNIIFAGDTTGGVVNHTSVDTYHVFNNADATVDFVDDTYYYAAEFTVSALDNDAATATAYAAVYTSPVDEKTVGFTIDNYELYRRTDVKYIPNDAVVADGVVAPVDGAYLYTKGNVKNDEALVTLADYCYEPVDNKRYVDGWVSVTDEIVYKAGDTINLAEVELDENGEYPLMPYVVAAEGYEFVDIKFVADGVTGTPKDMLGVYVTGDVINMASLYEGVTSAISGKRFNGWSINGEKSGIVQPYESLVIESDITFTPIVSYDFNFAIKDNCVGWSYSIGGVTYEDNLAKTWHKAGAGNDGYFCYTGVNAPTVDMHKLVLWAEVEYDVYPDKDHVNPAQKNTMKVGDSYEGFFFSHTGQGDAGARNTRGVVTEIVTAPDGKQYAAIECDPTTNANWQKDGLLYKIRFDPNNIYGGFNFRYVEIRDYEEYEVDSFDITDFDLPEVGKAPDAEFTVPAIAKASTITWTPELSAGGSFKALTEYSAEIVLNPADAKMRFDPDMPMTIGGVAAEFVSEEKLTGAITIKADFPATEDYLPFDFDLSTVPAEITVENIDSIQLEANITETTAGVSEEIVWVIESGDNASITEDGVLTVYSEGAITVKAISSYNENKIYTKDIVITLADTVKPVVVTFSNENINEAPAAITRLAGSVIDLHEYYNVSSTVEGKNFNGWSVDGKMLANEFVVPEEDVTLDAVVNYDINFAVPGNVTGWGYTGFVTHENDILVANNGSNTNGDVILSKGSGFNVPTSDYGKVYMYITEVCDVAGSEKILTVGASIEGIYFTRDIDDGAHQSRLVGGKVVAVENGLAKVEFNMASNANWTNNIKSIRFDIGGGLWSFGVRYIHFVENESYTANVVEITGIDVPVTGYDCDTTATDAAGLIDVTSVTWTPDEFIAFNYDGKDYVKYDAEKTYTVTVTGRIPSGSYKKFADDTTATLNGEAADFVKNADGTVSISYTFPATEAYDTFAMEIVGPEIISKEGRTVQYTLSIDNNNIPVKTASWKIAPEFDGYAVMNETNGKLTPVRSVENLKIIATSHYNPAITAEFYVTLENQAAESVVYYDENTTASVTNMPAATAGAGRIKLAEDVPERDGYLFAGWSESPESRTVVDAVVTDGTPVTVYAVWDKIALSFEFNNSNDGFTSIAQGTSKLHPEYIEVIAGNSANNNGDVRMTHKGGLTLNPKRSNRMVVRQSSSLTSSNGATCFFWIPGQGDILGNMKEGYSQITPGVNQSNTPTVTYNGLDDWQVFEIKFTDADWAASDNIPMLAYDPFQVKGETVYIDYIRFVDDCRDITFVANAGSDVVEGMPENYFAPVGENTNITAKPTRAGYEFLGWAKAADATETATVFNVYDDITLYAIWAKAVEVVDPTCVELGAIAENAIVITTAPNAEVTVTVTVAGEEINIPATANTKGMAVIDLANVQGTVENAVATATADIEKVVLTDKATADAIANPTTSSTDDKEGGFTIVEDEPVNTNKYQYDTTVETIKPTGSAVKPDGQIGGVGETADTGAGDGVSGDIKSDMANPGEIILNFNNKYEADFFPSASLRQFTLNGVSDSVIAFTNKGKASGSNDSPALFSTSFELDAANHPYIVMKIRNSTDSSCRIYFRTAEAGFAEARAMSKNVMSDYTMVVYDMSTLADWKGTVTGMFFSMGATAGEIIEIDWIMFTDKVPESVDAIEGTRELFPVVNKSAMTFDDVKSDDWFYSEVASAYRLGFVQGQSEKAYNPNGNVTVAETLTLAVRLNYSYNGKEMPTVADGEEWYKNYVDAAIRAGIIKNTQFADYNAPATRRDVAQIMYKTLPSDYLDAINMFTSIPDVTSKDAAYGAIRKLYNAGILMGTNEEYYFCPDNNVTRAEIAAVVNRMAMPSNRKRVITEAELESKRKYFYAEDLEAATLGNCHATKLSISNGFATATGKTGDPIVYLTNVVGQLNGKEITKITVALKWDESKIKASPVMFFTTPAGGWAAGRMLNSKNTGTKTAKGSTIFTLDPKSNGQFADTITGIRFDPFDAKDIDFSIEYIIIE